MCLRTRDYKHFNKILDHVNCDAPDGLLFPLSYGIIDVNCDFPHRSHMLKLEEGWPSTMAQHQRENDIDGSRICTNTTVTSGIFYRQPPAASHQPPATMTRARPTRTWMGRCGGR